MDILTQIAKRDDSAEHPTGNESADKKLRAIAKAKSRRGAVRELTAEDYNAIVASNAWRNGYLMVGRAQIVAKDRGNGTFLAFRL